MADKPFFSIVTISYNQAAYLREAIDSVLGQDFDDYEYIVQDPGSADGSRDILETYSKRLKVLYEKDIGPADGLNKAFAHASGRYYLFLNSDDILSPGALKYFYKWICKDQFRHHVFSGSCNIIDTSGVVFRRSYSDRMNLRRCAYGHCILIQPSTVFCSEQFWNVGGFNISNRINWDTELWVDMALNGCLFSTSNVSLSCYRIHSNSITGAASVASSQAMEESFKRIYQKIVGRDEAAHSSLLSAIYRYERKILNPLDTFQRVIGGRISGRCP